MAVLTALRSATAGLLRNPVLFVAAGILALAQFPQLAAGALDPLVASLVSLLSSLASIVLMPFFQAGLYGMADEAVDGRTRLATFVSAGKGHYVSMLVAYLLLLGAVFAFGIVVVIVGVLFLVFVIGSGGAPLENPVALAVGAVFGIVVALLYLGFVFFVQFYGQAIVVDDVGAIDGFRRSVGVVRANLLSTLGYSLLAGVIGLLFGGLATLATMLLTPERTELLALPTLSTPGAVAVGLGVFALTTAFTAFFASFSVAFYRGLSSREVATGAIPGAG